MNRHMRRRQSVQSRPGTGRSKRLPPWDIKFRLMRDPDGHDAGTPAAGGNNGESNGGQSSGDSQNANNGGQAFDLATFWNSPAADANKDAPSGDSAAPTSSAAGQQQQQQQSVNPTVAAINALDFGKTTMSESVMKDLAEGKTDSFHEAMNGFGRQSVESAMRMMLPIMGQLRDQLRAEMKTQVDGTLSNRDNMADLFKAIPSADRPEMRPQVMNIFEKAMTHTKGDRTSAIAMTKDMLRLTATSMDADLNIPTRSSGDGTAAVPSNTNWLEELAGR